LVSGETVIRHFLAGGLPAIALVVVFGGSGCSTTGVTSTGGTSGGQATQPAGIGGEAVVRLQHDHPEIDLSNYGRRFDAPSDKVIPLEVEFAMRNKEQFDDLMKQIADPHSPQYQRWLTPEEMHSRFGETQDQFNEVLQWLQEQGFTITDKSYGTNADYIRFKGTVGQVEKAFDVELVTPEFEHYAAKSDPAVPAKFDGVISRIVGLEEVGPLY
jgi:Pro-kumamolisin, activation domain